MKHLLFSALMAFVSSTIHAQENDNAFRAYLYNNDYNVFLNINFYEQNITVPGQELYGQLPGYLGKQNNTFCWVITSAKLKDDNTAEIMLINAYGSEDLIARLTRQNDSIYTFRQLDGSALKVPKNGRWQKLPKTFMLKRSKK